jgi:hypothetical protein
MIFVLGCVFAVLAGSCAYLITLHEMYHHFAGRWRAHAEALHRGAVITVFFIVVSGVIAVVLPYLMANR